MDKGVNVLGFPIRQCKGHCSTLPQQEKGHAFLADIRAGLRANGSAKPAAVIPTLHPLRRGWGNDSKHGVSKRLFHSVDHHVWKMLWRWARTRQPHKGKYGMAQQYFRPTHAARWTFNTTVKTRQGRQKPLMLVRLMDIPIERHITGAGTASPDDPARDSSWMKRQTQYGKTSWGKDAKLRKVAENQHWRCPVCGTHLLNGEARHTHHKRPVAQGGTDRVENLRHLHKTCHQQLHQMSRVQELLEA